MSDYQKNTFIYDLQIILVHKKKCWKTLLGCLLKVVSAKLDMKLLRQIKVGFDHG